VLQIKNVLVWILCLGSYFKANNSRYTPEDMEHAVKLVNDGYAVARAAEIAGVPRITLVDR
jgi:hypothetical protein